MDLLEFSADLLDWLSRIVTFAAIVGGLGQWAWKRHQRRTVQQFFGGQCITTYFPLRVLDGRTAIVEADFEAAHKLAAFLARFQIEVHFKFIDPGGRIDFTDPGLVAICGPKSSPVVADALRRDTAVSFVKGEDGYALEDRIDGRLFRSRRDVHNEKSDIGYFARNETGPGSGHRYLSIAGIHAEGSAVVVKHLCDYKTLRDLHKKTKGSLFSAVVGGTYQTEPLCVEATKLLALHVRSEIDDVTDDVAVVEEAEAARERDH